MNIWSAAVSSCSMRDGHEDLYSNERADGHTRYGIDEAIIIRYKIQNKENTPPSPFIHVILIYGSQHSNEHDCF